MTVPDTVVGLVVEALAPAGGYLWQQTGNAVPADDLVVFDGLVPPTPPRRYIVTYIGDGVRSPGPTFDDMAVSDEPSTEAFWWQTTAVAPDRAMASWIARTVRDYLVGRRITVDGHDPGLIRHTFTQLPQRDEQVLERPAVFAIDQYRLLSEQVDSSSS